MILLSHERFKRSRDEIDPERYARFNRKGVVDTLERLRDYWSVMEWLGHRAGHPRAARLPRFWSFDEAAAYFRPLRQDRPEFRTAYVVARYFARKGPEAWS
jgi:hypothetical protein